MCVALLSPVERKKKKKKWTRCSTFGPHYLGFLCQMSAAAVIPFYLVSIVTALIAHKTRHLNSTVQNPVSSVLSLMKSNLVLPVPFRVAAVRFALVVSTVSVLTFCHCQF